MEIRTFLVFYGALVASQANPNGSSSKGQSRNPRALVFPASSTVGIFIALAIPLDLPNRNVFLSYNFEANYNMPYQGSDILPGVDQRFEINFEEESDASDAAGTGTETLARTLSGDGNATTEAPKTQQFKTKRRKKKKMSLKSFIKRSALAKLLTRKNVYSGLEEKFKHAGYKGKPCLLRTICEVNAEDIGYYNGVTGSIIHMIFKPSSSEDEQISDDYYFAEYNGLMGECEMYHKDCPQSLLALFTTEYDPIFWD